MIRGCADYLAADTLSVNLHLLLGKVEPDKLGTTPISAPAVTALFKTPEVGASTTTDCDDIAVETESLADRLGLNKILNGGRDEEKTTLLPVAAAPTISGMPRFQSSLAWAVDSSPAILKSCERNPNVQDTEADMTATPVAASKSKRAALRVIAALEEDAEDAADGERLKKAKNGLEEALEKGREASKALKRKRAAPKRSILKDIANLKTPSVLEGVDAAVKGADKKRPKMDAKLSILTEEDKFEVKKPKKTTTAARVIGKSKKSKAPAPLMKGQMKMTAFLRM
jgi:hypothetical protein